MWVNVEILDSWELALLDECESCGHGIATRRVTFIPGYEVFVVCVSCAEAAADVVLVSTGR